MNNSTGFELLPACGKISNRWLEILRSQFSHQWCEKVQPVVAQLPFSAERTSARPWAFAESWPDLAIVQGLPAQINPAPRYHALVWQAAS
jgi:hypothetical protein